MAITIENICQLRRPYTPESVKFRPADKPDRRGSVRCLPYLDASLVRERLNDVDPDWFATYEFIGKTPSDPVGLAQYIPIVCRLSLNGIMREAVGQGTGSGANANAVKAAQSDALKRAALEFGVGAYLRALRTFSVDEKGYWTRGNGKVGGLTTIGTRDLRKQYTKWITHDLFVERFGEPTEYGHLADDERSVVPVPQEPAEAAQTALQTVQGVKS